MGSADTAPAPTSPSPVAAGTRPTWTKLGRVFEPPGDRDWMVSHAALPFALPLGGDRFRVFVSGRDASSRAQIGSFELALGDPDRGVPPRALGLDEAPSIRLGPLGAYDDSGVTGGCVTPYRDRLYHYFTGWSLGKTVPFYYFVGLAISEDGGRTFVKHSPAPILDRSPADPLLTASPCVHVEGDLWRMWYVSGVRWEIEDGQPKHYYRIQYAESDDGITWRRNGMPCLDFGAGEYAFGRPSVLADGGRYRMWYSYRGAAYRIGYAESADGRTWERMDARVGIDVSPDGWDSEMIEYPHVFKHAGRLYMLYNGNGYGRTGVGLAVLDERETGGRVASGRSVTDTLSDAPSTGE